MTEASIRKYALRARSNLKQSFQISSFVHPSVLRIVIVVIIPATSVANLSGEEMLSE
ncbi:hypothetical protein SDC9_194483 [bioreactor metagenome]|uniref:Uncharacterized protein n=1 Tax=bioreactor metagenome TaxID=1076179 RepID=A0A645IEZ7_9ZZZZ